MKLNKITIITLSITLVGGGIGVAMLIANTPSSYRATETMTPQASAPALPPFELNLESGIKNQELSDTPESLRAERSNPVNQGWRLYQNATYGFTLEYPPTWSVTEMESQIYFSPQAPARYEVERDPRIAFTIKPRADVLRARAGETAWFDAEVVANAERVDAVKILVNGITHYRFSEGMGEYPHQQSVVFRDDRVYWFEVQASDSAVHEAYKNIVATLRF